MVCVEVNKISERIEEETLKANALKDLGIITSFKIYEDPYDFQLKSLEKIHEPVLALYIEILLLLVRSPVLYDNTEELVSNHTRRKGKDILFEKRELYDFNETNKLESDVMAYTLSTINEIHICFPLSSNFIVEHEALMLEFHGDGGLNAERYKNNLSNKQKYVLEEKVTILAEKVLLHVFEQYE